MTLMTQMQIENLSTEEYNYFLAHGELDPAYDPDAELKLMLTEFEEVTNLRYAHQ